MRDITMGQYFPGDSLLHRAYPRAKLICAVLYIVLIFIARSALAFAMILAITFTLIAISGIPLRIFIKSMKPLLLIIIFTTVINLFLTRGEVLLVDFWIIKIYREGIINAVLMFLRITLLVMGSGLFLTYTTSPIALTDGLEQLLAPLKKIKIPVHEFSMMMTIALRFIPTLIEETDKIMNAQKARGADFSSGSLLSRARALLPILIPLFVSAFKRADELAVAMECRCYHGDKGRTRMTVLHYRWRDVAMMLTCVAVCAAAVLINIYLPLYTLVR